MSDLDQTADQLVAALHAVRHPADRYVVGPGSAASTCGPRGSITDADPNLNRYPQTSIVLSDSGRFHDIAWGHQYQHLLALDTETLPPEIAF